MLEVKAEVRAIRLVDSDLQRYVRRITIDHSQHAVKLVWDGLAF